jgi:K+-sensing histidine kinase KdpD
LHAGFDYNMVGSLERNHLHDTLKWTARTVWGLLLCSILALVSAYIFSNHRAAVLLPFLFVLVIVAIAARYGVTVGILGSIVSALIFAHMLFAPVHSLIVENTTERASLAWMVLGGIAIPYLIMPGLRSRK